MKSTCGLPSCQYWAYSKWLVTGATTALSLQMTTTTKNASAVNLATTVDEQRISAQITVNIDDQSGKITYGSATREITARTLNVAPYLVVTGVKDVQTAAGQARSVEGDTGGAVGTTKTSYLISPNANFPADITDTRIHTDLDCVNSGAADNQADPYADKAKSVDHSIRKFGDQDWQFEVPCVPSYHVAVPQNLSGYIPQVGRIYGTVSSDGRDQWNKGAGQGVFRN